jgi:hypothetical protein
MALASDLVQVGIPSRQADFLGDTTEDGIGATGGIQATAYQLTANINTVTTSTVATAEAVKLPLVLLAKQSQFVVRNDSANTITIFPGIGDNIGTNGANVAITLPASSTAIFWKQSPTKWTVKI